MNLVENLRSRWRPEWTGRHDLGKLHGALSFALAQIEDVPAHRASLEKGGRLTKNGVSDDVRKFAAEKVIPGLRRGSWEAERALSAAKHRRLQLAIKPADKTDVAGALLRQETRAYLRGLDQGERVRLVMTDPVYLTAAMEGPAALSGMTDDLRTELQDRLIENAHGPAVEALREAEEAIELVQASIDSAVNVIRAACDFDRGHEFDAFMKTASAHIEAEIAGEQALKPSPPQSLSLPNDTVQLLDLAISSGLGADVTRQIVKTSKAGA